MNTSLRRLIRATSFATLLALTGHAFAADDPCTAYKWDVSNEVKLFAGAPTSLAVAASLDKAPAISTGTLYALALQPQETVTYPVAPSKKMLPDGSFGGLLKFKVGQAGAYRVSIDSGFWLDVVADGKSLQAADFNGQRACGGPHKIVVYELPAGTDLVLQIASAGEAQARLTVTAVAAPKP